MKILIIGATSAIAEASARIWAQRGDELFLVARNQERLEVLAKDLKIRGAFAVHQYLMDVIQFDRHCLMLDQVNRILGTIDIVLIAHGTLGNQKKCEKSAELTIQEIQTNGLSVIALLTVLADHFEKQKSGVIAVIGSVAGDRGRQSNYVYGSAKAMVSTFTSGLRQRLFRFGVSVVTVKPGFVDTPMTKEFEKSILWASPEKVGKSIVKACSGINGEIYSPSFWMYIMLVVKLIPEALFKRMKI
jgi:short-subunit dehydrogenase